MFQSKKRSNEFLSERNDEPQITDALIPANSWHRMVRRSSMDGTPLVPPVRGFRGFSASGLDR